MAKNALFWYPDVIVHNTTTAMLADLNPSGLPMRTIGYSSKTDGYGNIYYYDSVATDTPDCGNILPGVGGSISVDIDGAFDGTLGTGRYFAMEYRYETGYFGADLTGATNARHIVQLMFDSIPSGKTAVFSPGTHLFQVDSAGQSWVNVIDKSLTVEAHGATIYMDAATDYYALRFYSTTDTADALLYFHWFGGTLDGNRTNQNYTDAVDGVHGTGTYKLDAANRAMLFVTNYKLATINNLTLQAFVDNGIEVRTCRHSVISSCQFIDGGKPPTDSFPGAVRFFPNVAGSETVCIVENCLAKDCNIGFLGQDAAFRDATMQITNCRAYDCYQSSAYNEACERFYITDCDFYHSTKPYHHAIQSLASAEVIVSNTRLEGGSMHLGAFNAVNQKSRVTNCYVTGDLNTDGESTINGAWFVDNCVVINSADAAGAYAISAKYVSNCLVDMTGTTRRGIEGGLKVANCFVYGDETTGGLYGVAATSVIGCSITGFTNGVYTTTSGAAYVSDCSIGMTQGCAIQFNNAALHGYVSNCSLYDFGRDTGLSNDLQVGIGQNSTAGNMYLTNVRFRRTDAATTCRQAISLGSSGAPLAYLGITNCTSESMRSAIVYYATVQEGAITVLTGS